MSSPDLTSHLTPETMARAHRDLVAKAIAELTHERLLEPVDEGDQWRLDLGASTYEFTARRHPLEHWVVDADVDRRTVAGEPVPVDAQDFIIELRATGSASPTQLLPVYLEEIASTLARRRWKLSPPPALRRRPGRTPTTRRSRRR